MVKKRKTIRLEERDFDILRHVGRYKLTVVEALERMPFFDQGSPHAAKEALRRLRNGGYLKSETLYRTRRYYHLTRAAANVLDEHPSLANPLTEEPKVRAFAMLSYCCLCEPTQEKLTLAEFRSHFPTLYRDGERPSYYVDTHAARKRLGYLRVDHGGFGRWDRVIGKLRDDIAKRCDLPDFRELIVNRGFVITILTALDRKAERIREAIEEADLPCDVQVFVVPGLLELIAPAPS